MITPIEFRIQCDAGAACRDPQKIGGRPLAFWTIVRARTMTDARKQAKQQGWRRQRLDNRLVDICPTCARV